MADTDRFRPAIGREAIRRSAGLLARDGYVRIPGFLDERSAEVLAAHLAAIAGWTLAMRLGSKDWDATPDEQEAIGLARLEAMAKSATIDDFGFLFDVVRVSPHGHERADRGMLIDKLADSWSHPPAMAIWMDLTGRKDLTGVTMSATRYRPGHFLSRHNDGQDGKRAAAFSLSLSRDWRTEWGGLLEFVDDEGRIEQAFTPEYNSLVLFNVPREHIVSAVSPNAPAARLTISGWLTCGAD
ncbi:MAG: 2OG-Fe(II) oxygenase family protein [Novosphingobium sp.]